MSVNGKRRLSKSRAVGSSPATPAMSIRIMSKISQKICYRIVAWHIKPKKLIRRATYFDKPEHLYKQTYRLGEGIIFFVKLHLRFVIMYCLAVAYKDTGYSPIGFGYFTNALRDGDEVIKLYEFSAKCSIVDQQNLVCHHCKNV